MSVIAPHPFGTTVTLPQLKQLFGSLGHNEERLRQLILLSRQLPALPEQYRQPQYQLSGCENRVWLGHQPLPDGGLHFFADSDGRIVRGIIAILLTAVEGKRPEQIRQYDLMMLLQEFGIQQQLSASRSLGVRGIVEAIREIGGD